MAQLFKNNAFSALAASLTNVATTLTVTTGHGDRFPAVSGSDFFMLTLQDASNNVEIVKVTARTAGADSMTIVRAQEGFTARAWNMGDVVELRVTSFALNPLSVFAGAATAQAMRDAMAAPSRTGGDASGNWSIDISGNAATATYATSAGSATTAGSCTGNAATVTNGVYTTGSYADPAWITSLNYSKLTGTVPTWNQNTTGNAATVTNGVYTVGNQSVGGIKTFTGAYIDIAGVSGAYSGTMYMGGTRQLRQVSADSRWEMVNAANSAVIFTFANNGEFTASGNVTAYSDERLKKDWQDLPADFIERLAFVKHGTYTRKDTGERQAGASAQDMQRLLAEFVGEGPDGFLSLAYGNAALVAAVQLSMRVIDLEARLKALEAN